MAGRKCHIHVSCYYNTSAAKSAPTIKVTEPRAGPPGFQALISKAAPATTQPCYKADLEGVKKDVAGDQTDLQAKDKGLCSSPGDSLKAWKGSLHDQSSGVLAQGAPPNLCGVFACSMEPLPSTLTSLVGSVGWGGEMEADPTSGKAERSQNKSLGNS